MTNEAAPILAVQTRSGVIEWVHRGTAVIVGPDGSVLESWGDPTQSIFPRSSNKPFQAAAMVESGLDLPTDLLALASASHRGEPMHLAGVRRILELAGLAESDLQTPPDYPLDPDERDAWVRDGRGPTRSAMTCSGKHAAMLTTCVVNGWPTSDYPSPDHPLQRSIRAYVESIADERVEHVGVDGCGAPVLSLSVVGLARALSRSVLADAESASGRVIAAIRAYPELVAGPNTDVTAFMRAVPGLVAKDGGTGVFVLALADGTAIALRIDDGSAQARQVVAAALLDRLGSGSPGVKALANIPVSGGAVVVGQVSSTI